MWKSAFKKGGCFVLPLDLLTRFSGGGTHESSFYQYPQLIIPDIERAGEGSLTGDVVLSMLRAHSGHFV